MTIKQRNIKGDYDFMKLTKRVFKEDVDPDFFNDAVEQSVNRTISANYDAEIKQILDYIDEVISIIRKSKKHFSLKISLLLLRLFF